MNRIRRIHRVIITACVAAWGALASSVIAAPPTIQASPIFKDFASRWQDALTSVGAPGFAVVVVKDGEVILLDAMGVRDVDSKKPVTPDTMFYIASATKPFNAMSALALADAGALNIDAPVGKYLPQLELADTELTEKLTVRDLMCHRHGINNVDIVFHDAYSGLITDELYFELLKAATIEHEPDYTNVHFTLLGRVIQSVAGNPWPDVLEERILSPAGMSRTTGYASRMYGDDNCAYPHDWYDGAFHRSSVMKTDRTMHAAGGMGTTARDLGRWLILNMGGGKIDGKQIVSQARVDDMLEMHAQLATSSGQIRVRQGFGLGWGRGTYRGRPYAFHGGGYIGAAAYVSFLPEEKIGMAVLVNCGNTGQGLTDVISVDIYDKLLGLNEGDLLPGYQRMAERFRSEGPKPPAGKNPAVSGELSLAADNYAGRFANDKWGVIDVTIDAGSMGMTLGDMNLTPFTKEGESFEAMLTPGQTYDGRFEIVDGKVAAITMTLSEETSARFERR